MANQLTAEHKAKMMAAAKKKRDEAKKNLEAAIAGRAAQEKKLATLEIKRQQFLKKVDEKINREKRRLANKPERKERTRIMTRAGVAIMEHWDLMDEPQTVLEELYKVHERTTNKPLQDDLIALIKIVEADQRYAKRYLHQSSSTTPSAAPAATAATAATAAPAKANMP